VGRLLAPVQTRPETLPTSPFVLPAFLAIAAAESFRRFRGPAFVAAASPGALPSRSPLSSASGCPVRSGVREAMLPSKSPRDPPSSLAISSRSAATGNRTWTPQRTSGVSTCAIGRTEHIPGAGRFELNTRHSRLFPLRPGLERCGELFDTTPRTFLLRNDLRWYAENIATDFYSEYHRYFPERPNNWKFVELVSSISSLISSKAGHLGTSAGI
jgi:hypothetical protein